MSITDPTEHPWRLPLNPSSTSRARALLRAQLRQWRIEDEVIATAELLLSELVTNAVNHAKTAPSGEIGVRITRRQGLLRLEVTDSGSRPPERRSAAVDDQGGRGLMLVSALGTSWGYRPRRDGAGKTVWVELKII
ncbi:ATP-binding protein [Streptomyces albipurpureus]|uniref:ATP-binding protein n=1 Tax=Streptomyces albipurpureus TaxID=2897419 RepID=A0ABT0UVK6_9ACTN|nr:ATP-binding protein [Streptomyces sp. CWNU-1]MCM2392135.1 ATP-binding protein [Streptomyces sp. CWNU-1]